MERANETEMSSLGQSLHPLAEQCYEVLLDCADIELRLRSKNEKENTPLLSSPHTA